MSYEEIRTDLYAVQPATADHSPGEYFGIIFPAEGANMYTEMQVRDMLDGVSGEWRFKKERSLDGQWLHWQACAKTHGKTTKKKVMAHWKEVMGIASLDGVCIVKARNYQAMRKYILKKETAAGEVVQSKVWQDPRFLTAVLRPWQQVLMDLPANDRVIDIVYDPKGCRGKSFFCGYVDVKGLGIDLSGMSNSEEAIKSLCCVLTETDNHVPRRVLINIPRRASTKDLHGWVRICEMLKDGKVIDARYRYRSFRFVPPTVIVFCNELPDILGYDASRLRVWKFVEGEDLDGPEMEMMDLGEAKAICQALEDNKAKPSPTKVRIADALEGIQEMLRRDPRVIDLTHGPGTKGMQPFTPKSTPVKQEEEEGEEIGAEDSSRSSDTFIAKSDEEEEEEEHVVRWEPYESDDETQMVPSVAVARPFPPPPSPLVRSTGIYRSPATPMNHKRKSLGFIGHRSLKRR